MGVEYYLADVERKEAFELGKGWHRDTEDPATYRRTPIPMVSGPDDVERWVRASYWYADEAEQGGYLSTVVERLRAWLEPRWPAALRLVNDADDSDEGYHHTGSRYDPDENDWCPGCDYGPCTMLGKVRL